MLDAIHAFLTSPVLAIALLVVVLACCVIAVTVIGGTKSGPLIFETLWFNGLLVLLAVSSGITFFSRIWKRKLTLVSAGMILFHLSFVALLGAIVYNRLFFFTGVLRLTEGETLPNDQLESYDSFQKGRLFGVERLRGATTLVRMHRDFQVDGDNKRAAYEIEVGDAPPRRRGIIYPTEYMDVDGVRYFRSKEGYSVLLVAERDGAVVYGAHIPLQSYRQPDGTFRYATGNVGGEIAYAFPPPPDQQVDVAIVFRPSAVKEREGEVTLRVWPKDVLPDAERVRTMVDGKAAPVAKPAAAAGPADPHAAMNVYTPPPPTRKGTVVVGAPFDAGPFTLTLREIRYWVGMDVRYDPGINIILGSLTAGLVGMTLILAGRIRQGGGRRRAQGQAPAAAAPREEVA